MTISIILFQTLEAQMGIRATYTCPRKVLTTNHTTKAFVDNSTNFINSKTNDEQYTADQLSRKLQLQNEEWERILSTSGGKLELPKCLAYIIVYNWIKGEPKQRPKTLLPSNLMVKDTESQQPTNIDIKDLLDSHKTLGTHQNPAGDLMYQSKMLSHKEKKMITFFTHSKLPKYKVHLVYHSMYTKACSFHLVLQ
jgi:hypothetical protein